MQRQLGGRDPIDPRIPAETAVDETGGYHPELDDPMLPLLGGKVFDEPYADEHLEGKRHDLVGAEERGDTSPTHSRDYELNRVNRRKDRRESIEKDGVDWNIRPSVR